MRRRRREGPTFPLFRVSPREEVGSCGFLVFVIRTQLCKPLRLRESPSLECLSLSLSLLFLWRRKTSLANEAFLPTKEAALSFRGPAHTLRPISSPSPPPACVSWGGPHPLRTGRLAQPLSPPVSRLPSLMCATCQPVSLARAHDPAPPPLIITQLPGGRASRSCRECNPSLN